MGFWRPSSSRAVVVGASFRGRCPRLWGSLRCCLDGGGSPYLGVWWRRLVVGFFHRGASLG
eukprot:9907957-Alexandrium_andersonii.AAC.1